MKYVGVDLHKQVISVCVMGQSGGQRKVLARQRLACQDAQGIERFFRSLGKFQAVVEATASYEWFVELVEPLADRVILAHPRKLRVIAESTRKTDKLDAQVLAEFLALDMIPQSHRPSPRVRQHRALVRQRHFIQRRITSAKCKVRHILARYNADQKYLFTEEGREHLAKVQLLPTDRFVVQQLLADLEHHHRQLLASARELKQFAKTAPLAEREAREVLARVPCVGTVTADILLAELGDLRRFRNQRQVAAYAGLVPRVRESAGNRQDGRITKEGSGLLRWALIQTAWRLVTKTRRWGLTYEKLKNRAGPKRAIVAVARRILAVMFGLLRRGERYSMATEAHC
jgi:transposase